MSETKVIHTDIDNLKIGEIMIVAYYKSDDGSTVVNEISKFSRFDELVEISEMLTKGFMEFLSIFFSHDKIERVGIYIQYYLDKLKKPPVVCGWKHKF